ncbi:hypothetical protein SprV_0702371200 [Sparganum proliferum]
MEVMGRAGVLGIHPMLGQIQLRWIGGVVEVDDKCLNWIFPPIGHVGIADSKGIIYDFAGPYYIGEDNMAFGWPTKYHQIDLSLVGDTDTWDRGVWEANAEYKQRVHNLCCDNCHSHVAYAFNSMHYNGKSNWNMYSVWWFIFIHGKYTNFGGFLRTWLPFLILLTIVLLIAFLV